MQGSFLVILGVQDPLPLFSRCSVQIVLLVDELLMYSWGEINTRFSYPAILAALLECLIKIFIVRPSHINANSVGLKYWLAICTF